MNFLLVIFSVIALTSTAAAQEVATYEEIKDLPNHPEILLIDVREPYELEQTGQIPTSINIPSASLAWALGLIPPKFYSIYHREKPQESDSIIFTCRSGARALAAAQNAMSLGFTNVRYYRGSWLEWCVLEQLCTDD